MSEKVIREKFVTPVGVAVYPHLVRPDTKFDSDGVYTVQLAIEAKEAVGIIDQLQNARDKFAAEFADESPKNKAKIAKARIADVFDDEVDDEGELTGRVLIRAKQKAIIRGRDGEEYVKTVKLFDAQNNRITPSSVWGGSRLILAGVLIPYYMASTKEVGVSLRLGAAQILELVEGDGGNAESFGFGEQEGYTAPDDTTADDAGGDDNDGEAEDF